jgi:hypothetical protein
MMVYRKRKSRLEVENEIERERVKKILKKYKYDLDYIDMKMDKRDNLRASIDGIKVCMSDSEAVQGGGSTQEEKIIKVIDKINEIDKEITEIRLENADIRYALKNLKDDDYRSIVYHIWINNDMTMEQMGKKLHLSKTAVWKKSDHALKAISKILKEY